MLIIGQSLECWRPPLADAVVRREAAPLIARTRRQVEAGATALDMNFGAAGRGGLADDLVWAAQVVRDELPRVPLFLDCGNLDALALAVEATPGPVVVNAVPIEASTPRELARVLEATANAGAGVVFSPCAADRSEDEAAILEAANDAAELSARAHVRGPMYLDCLTYPPASDLERCRRSLRWVAALGNSGPPGVAPLVAIGNLGHGAPREERRAVRMVYVALAAALGAGAMILRAEDAELMSLVSTLEGRSPPRTSFERWAAALQRSRTTVEAPPGIAERAGWELLWQR